jgi:hypothetical protein
MSDIKVYRTEKNFPNSKIPEGFESFKSNLKEIHMINSRKKNPSLVFITEDQKGHFGIQNRIEVSFEDLNKALAELGYTLYQP